MSTRNAILHAAGERLRWIAAGRTGAAAVMQTLLSRSGMLGANFITGVIVSRALLPQGRGESTAISAWPLLFSSLLSLGLPLAVIYNVGHDRTRERDFFSAAIIGTLVTGSVSAGIGALLIPGVLHHYSQPLVRDAQYLMAFAPLMLVQYVLQAALESQGRFSVMNRLNYVPAVCTVVALAALAALHRLTPFRAALCYFSPAAVLTLATFWNLRALLPLRVRQWRRTYRDLFSYGLKTYVNELVTSFSAQLRTGILVGLLTARQLGIVTVAGSVSGTLNIVTTSLAVVLFPKTVGKSEHEITAIAGHAARVGAIVSLFGGIILSVLMRLLLPFVYGRAFSPAIPIAQLFIVQQVIAGMASVLAQPFTIVGKQVVLALFEVGALTSSVVLFVVLIPRFGLFGVPCGTIAAALLRLALVLASYPLVLHQPIPAVLIGKADVAFVRRHLGALKRTGS